MTLTQEILNAIRTAPETVEWRTNKEGNWIEYTTNAPVAGISSIINYDWRIKPKPYEARHEIWVNEKPLVERTNKWEQQFAMGLRLSEFLLGRINTWIEVKTEKCTKKYEIIVREIIE